MAAMANAAGWDLPTAFYFKIAFVGEPKIDEIAFQEVSGLSLQVDVESVQEGGLNAFEHQLPKPAKHGNLVLKRALLPLSKINEVVFNKWFQTVFRGDYSQPIVTRDVLVYLLNAQGQTLHLWSCSNAYPVKWDAESFESQKNNVALVSMEFAYRNLEQKK